MRKQPHVSGYVSKVKSLSEREISAQFHLPIIAAAKKLGVCVTALKSRCRQLGISRWPYRKVRKVDNVIKALVDQKAVLEPQKAVEKCFLQNALHIRNHILSNPNSTAHLKIKKRKNSTSFSEDASSDTSSEQIFRGDNYSVDAMDKNAESEEKEVVTASQSVGQKVQREAEVAFAVNKAPQGGLADQKLIQSLNFPPIQMQAQTPLYAAPSLAMWQQLPVNLLANCTAIPNTMPLQQMMQKTQAEIYKEQFAKALGSGISFNNMGGLMYNNFPGQNPMLQMALEQRWNCAMQANLAKCVILNK